MSEVLTHNERLPLPRDVLPINPEFILLDGVEELELGKAVGFWTPTEEQCHLVSESGVHVAALTSMATEAMSQLAAYTLMHGSKESRFPHLTGVDYIRGRHPLFTGKLFRITADVETRRNAYFSKSDIFSVEENQLAYYGVIRGALLREGETWVDASPEPPHIRSKKLRDSQPIHRDRSHEFYRKVVDASKIPKLKGRTDGPTVDFKILTDDAISIDEKVIPVRGNRLFVLNALLLNLGRELTRREVEDMGFSPGSPTGAKQANFANAKNALLEELKTSSDQPLLLQRFGEKRRGYYQLDPNVEYVFYDRRQESGR